MKRLELQDFGVVEMNAREISGVDGGGYGFLWFLAERAWEYRDDIIGTSHAISAAYKKHPEALLK